MGAAEKTHADKHRITLWQRACVARGLAPVRLRSNRNPVEAIASRLTPAGIALFVKSQGSKYAARLACMLKKA
ncbi:hypothetical protein C9I50_25190 [Pseudomonas prosekii]|nr:hypothetical protein C9I50_25190 [Pseudomonas prosekii]